MSKRLIMVLALAFVLGLAFSAYAEVQNVKVSGDLNVYGISRNLTLSSSRTENTMASIVRLRVDADLTDNVMATVRLINERYWGSAYETTSSVQGSAASVGATDFVGGLDQTHNTVIDLDLAYATLKEFLYSPLTLTIGRQELHFGNDMIIGDPYTNNRAATDSVFNGTIDRDLSMRKSFDAVRATLNYDPLVVDVLYAQIQKSSHAVNANAAQQALNIDRQQQLYGINANYKLSKNTTIEGYAWERRLGKKDSNASINKVDRTDVFGARIITTPINNLTFQAEGAFQFGQVARTTIPQNGINDTQKRQAWAAETALTYDLKDCKNIGKYKPNVTALYAYFSGNRGSANKTTAWDPMYENQSFGNIANLLFNQSNAHIVGGILSAKPVDDVTLKGEYYAFWWDKRFNDGAFAAATATGETLKMTSNKFAGQELDLTATYDYTEDVQFSLLTGILLPGNSFDRENRNAATEVLGSMKVTF